MKKVILFLGDIGHYARKSSEQGNVFRFVRLAVSRLMERTKKEPAPQAFGKPMIVESTYHGSKSPFLMVIS